MRILAQTPAPTPHPEPIAGDQVTSDLDLETDVCIVGSGAGGAVLAAELAQKGKRVIVLEEGGHNTKKRFNMKEGDMFPLLYQERGGRATADQGIIILQGRTLGGSTVVNYTTSYRTPDKTLAYWKSEYGVEGLDATTLGPAWDKVEKRLSITQIELERINANNRILWNGAEKLGWEKHLLHRNVSGCMHSGYCAVGCPIDAKQAMHITYIVDALKAGAVVHTNARVEKLERAGNRIAAVHATVLDPATEKPTGKKIRVRAKLVAVCGGGINSPLLLMKSGINEGPVGKRGWFHPLTGVIAKMPTRVEAFYGAPQSVASRQWADRGDKMGYFIETTALHPVLGAAFGTVGFGKKHRESMESLPFKGGMYAHFIDGFSREEPGATVTVKPSGMPSVDYPITPRFVEALRDGMKSMCRIGLAAGATEVQTLHNDPVTVKSEADLDKIDAPPIEPNRIVLATAHLMGGCAMGKDPKDSVVRSDLRHHVVENLYVVDGSVFPTSSAVNPQLTIYGIATHASAGIAAAIV